MRLQHARPASTEPTPVYVQGYQPVMPPGQPSASYTPSSSPQQGYPLYLPQVPQAEINKALMQALVFGTILVAVGVVLVMVSRFLSVPVFLGIHYLIYGGMNFFAGRQTARKHGNVSLSLLTCFLANGSYLALLSAGYSLLPSSFHMSMVSFIISNLLIALSLGALGGTLGSKRARKKEADLSRQGGTGCIIARAQTECEASPEKMDERHHSFC